MPSHVDIPAQQRTLIEAITVQDILQDSELHGHYDLKTSLSLHFDQAFALFDLFPHELSDWQLRRALEQALGSRSAASHVNAFFKRTPDTPVPLQECAFFFRTLVMRAIPEDLSKLPTSITPYRACSLAQTLWSQGLCHKRRDAFLMASLLLLSDLSTQPPQPLAPAALVEVEGYLEPSLLVSHLLRAPAGCSLADRLFHELDADVYFQGARYRAPTPREREAGRVPDQYGKVFLPGVALNAPSSQALDALLHSAAFARWALRLGDAIQLASTCDSRALAEQAIVDTLYPPEDRRPGYLLDFELFNSHNTMLPFAQIRLDLVNSVQGSLRCLPAVAELTSELLLRRFAPELLLDDIPAGIPYLPGLDWAILRQGVMVLRARQLPLTFEGAYRIANEPLDDDSAASEALRETLTQWGPLQGHVDTLPPWSARQWQQVYDHYLIAWDMDSIQQRPDRMAEAARLLKAAGIDPAGHNVDGQLHLEAYVDERIGYTATGLPNVTDWYEHAFDNWKEAAAKRYEGLLQRLARHLAGEQREQLCEGRWTCYAAIWPRYHGPDPVPPYGDSAAHFWHQEVGTRGLLIQLHGEQRDTLLELFPERLHARHWSIASTASEHLAAGVELSYHDYNGADPTWDVASLHGGLKKLCESPESAKLEALANVYANAVALGNSDVLRAAGKGATRHEAFLAERRKVSDWGYLWNLIKRTVPLVACVDVKNGEDATSCALDLLGGASVIAGASLRTASSLSRVFGTNTQAAKAARASLETVARRWSVQAQLPAAVYDRTLGPRRWHSMPDLPAAGAWPDTFTLDRLPPPGLTPGQLMRDRLAPPGTTLAWGDGERPIMIARADDHADAIINGEAYRYRPTDQNHTLRRVRNEILLTTPTQEVAPYSTYGEPSIALLFTPPEIEAGTPLFGQHVSRAFLTVRVEPAEIRARDVLIGKNAQARVMVREGKVIDAKTMKALPRLRAEVSLGIITPPVYHRRITVDPLAEFWFGLPTDVPPLNAEILARLSPPVRLGGLARTVADRRTVRAAIIEWQEADWIIVEADTGVFYAARHEPWLWQARQLENVGNHTLGPAHRPMPPRDQRRVLSRVRDENMIQRYLDLSESYRIVASRQNLQGDIDNLSTLLRDWLQHGRASQPARMSPFQELLDAAEARMLPEFAKNILTNTRAQDALTGVMKSGLVGLNREIIPTWRPLQQAGMLEQAHTNRILNTLLPASGSPGPYAAMTVAELLSDAGAQYLRQHLPGANLAFVTVALDDGSRRVYFSLSGGKQNRHFKIATPPPDSQLRITYIDALERMQGVTPSPRFTELPILRRPTELNIRWHHRHLDSERLIATVISDDLLEQSERVKSIQVFTLFSTCRSCGGYVLPRLRLDFDKASFSVSWLVDYRE